MRRQLSLGRARRGVAAVEFGFWFFLIVLMLSGIIDFGWYMARSEIVMRAARDGARQGAATFVASNQAPGTIIPPAANAAALDVLSAAGYGGCSRNTTVNTDGNGLRVLTTTVNCPYQPLLGIAPGLSNTISYSFTMYAEMQPI